MTPIDYRIAICNEVYGDWSPERSCAHARALGYRGLEIAPHTLGTADERFSDAAIRPWQAAAHANDLKIIGLHWLLAQTQGLHWTSDDPSVRNATATYLARLAELCETMGGELMVLGSPGQRQLTAGMSLQRGTDNACDVVERLLPHLERHRIILAVEPLGPQETNFLNTADQAAQLIERFQSQWVRLHLDVKAMSSESSSIPEIISKHRAILAHFHANDPNRQGPGMGQTDFVPILRALQDVNYRGWISVEVFDLSPGVDALVGDSIRNLQRDLAAAGSQTE